MNVTRRRLAFGSLGALALAGAIPRTLWAAAAGDDFYAGVDPQLLPAIKSQPVMTFTRENIAETRRARAVTPVPTPPPAPQPTTRTIPGRSGGPDVRIIVVDPPRREQLRGALVHMHGGGYIFGSAEPNRPQRYAADCGCVVVSVDYRLAPETPFPGPLEDCYAALAWVHANADMLGVDPRRVAVGGESAGGGLAAMLAIAARDRGEFPVAFQLLTYPMLDDRTASTRTMPSHLGRFAWTPGSNRLGWSSLLGVPAGSSVVPKGAVPARIESVAGLPPAFIGVGTLDLFVDEDIDYSRRLIEAGVLTELLVVPGAYHAFDVRVPDADVSVRFAAARTSALKRAVGIQTRE